jgi:Uri superfamily endonuclease
MALDAPALVRVGALGEVRFAVGAYAYVGSAFGPGGLAARLARHHRTDKPPHWHIDYLRPHVRLLETWQAAGPLRLECGWACALAAWPGASMPVRGFGASDCHCEAHLFHFAGVRELRAAQDALGSVQVLPGE